MKGYSDEFPLLEGVGLYASDISGDGDCLFHALSDQVCTSFTTLRVAWFFQTPDSKPFHSSTAMKTIMPRSEKRWLSVSRLVTWRNKPPLPESLTDLSLDMKVHAGYFKLFLDVGPTRRAPRRKGTAGANQPIVGPTEDAIDKAFAQHLKRMSQSGVYGDNMEISAFARDYNCDVKIYQRDFAYVVTGGEGASGLKSIMHIAYHVSIYSGRSSHFLPPSPYLPPFPRPSHE